MDLALSIPEQSAAIGDRIAIETGQGKHVRLIETILCQHAVLIMAAIGPFPECPSVKIGVGDV